MIAAYKAPVSSDDAKAIVDYLVYTNHRPANASWQRQRIRAAKL
jgi:hypothetical protein